MRERNRLTNVPDEPIFEDYEVPKTKTWDFLYIRAQL